MATHRAIPGANLPETGTSSRKGRGAEVGTGASSFSDSQSTGMLAGETGLGAGFGTGSTNQDSDSNASRAYPRAVGVMDQVKQTASSRVNEQKVRAADGLGSVANAIRQASEHMRAENQTLASYADTAVDQIQLFADRMRDKDPAEMVRDVERFARRNPGAFVGGAFLLGLGLARFLKSSSAYELGDGDVPHHDSGFGEGASRLTTPLPGQTGFTAPIGGPSRSGDSGIGGSLGLDPAPGITS
ncbi:hypothetical protein TBR22_A29700 [Luteitalea sp. TBR-22]|uniref:hypothetical protein n=1 Tax=Luteitalea sp. TBR-22 TaxID=2802971 RepID=UPI001AF8EF17|nr:hypothetical protein [Luteitalea sp. TBR-22]BCS33743.1 hypothetical protein TBR22_A29700 [Luteitalea sp. TBR-22]